MGLKQIDHGSREYRQMVTLREQLLRKPLGMTFTSEELDNEKDEVMIGSFDEEDMLGCCILTKVDENTVRLRQMANLSTIIFFTLVAISDMVVEFS